MQNSFLRANFSPLAVCPPVELCLLMELFLLERGAMAHPQHTKRRNCWDPQVRASPTWHLCLVWPNACKHTGSCKSQKQSSLVCNITYINKAQLANVGAAPQWQALLHLVSKSSTAPNLQFSFLQRACFCHALKARAESVPTARNVVIPSCFSFAYFKGSSSSY